MASNLPMHPSGCGCLVCASPYNLTTTNVSSTTGMYVQFLDQPQSVLELPVEIVATQVTGYRVWLVEKPEHILIRKEDLRGNLEDRFRVQLVSAATGVPWDESSPAASCRVDGTNHDKPQAHCTCGYWMMKDEKNLPLVISNYTHQQVMYAYGSVEGWGQIVETTMGYRAQYARPRDLTLIGGNEEMADELAERYGCQVKLGTRPEYVGSSMTTGATNTTVTMFTTNYLPSTWSSSTRGIAATTNSIAGATSTFSFPSVYRSLPVSTNTNTSRYYQWIIKLTIWEITLAVTITMLHLVGAI